jgi:hypothetical protein
LVVFFYHGLVYVTMHGAGTGVSQATRETDLRNSWAAVSIPQFPALPATSQCQKSHLSLFDSVMHAFMKSAPEPDAQPYVASVQWAAELSGLRVLLVEDNEINRELASQLLRDVGIGVAVAQNGRQAVEKVFH